MDYFLMKQPGIVSIPRSNLTDPEEASVRIMEDISPLEKFDYLAAEALVSDRVKLLLEQYLPDQEWSPCAFVELSRQKQKTFWFLPILSYMPDQVVTASDGTLLSFLIKKEDFAKRSPGIFCIPNPKGPPSVAVHLSIAESILRRGFCGLELIRLSDTPGS